MGSTSFIGYPVWRRGAEFDQHNLFNCLVSPALSDQEWYREDLCEDRGREANANHNLVREVDGEDGSIVLVPRPDRGLVYAGYVGRFEVVDDPPWINQYMQLRDDQSCEEGGGFQSHVGDVTQGWPVKEFIPLPYTAVPSWIRKSFNGRRQHGRVPGVADLSLDPYPRMQAILRSRGLPERLSWTTNLAAVEQRLVDYIGPQSFEHLCVGLLQVANPDQSWFHVGGSGDGGVDGLGYDAGGSIRGILQCKWEYWGGELPFLHTAGTAAIRYIAALVHPDERHLEVPSGAAFLSRRRIAELVLENSARLSQAVSLRIGTGIDGPK